jgi:hypothetical protein
MNTKYIYLIAFILYFFQYNITAQPISTNCNLERYIDRPLTLHKNNFEFACGYEFGALLNTFDENGKNINLADAGIAASKYMLEFQLTYGITERLQLQTLISNNSYKKTFSPVVYKGIGNNLLQFYEIQTKTGFSDPNIRLNYLLLNNDCKLSLSFGGGISVPIFKYRPENPEIDSSGEDLVTKYQFVYKYHNGLGTPVYNLNIVLKYRFGDIGGNNFLSKVNARLLTDYYTAPSTISTNDWQYIFNSEYPNSVTYQSLPLKYKEGSWFSNRLFIDYQAFSITSFLMGFSNKYYFHGWTQYSSMKVAENDLYESDLLLGTHIQATSQFRIDELITVPVCGENTESYFTWQTALIYYIKK